MERSVHPAARRGSVNTWTLSAAPAVPTSESSVLVEIKWSARLPVVVLFVWESIERMLKVLVVLCMVSIYGMCMYETYLPVNA